MNWQAAASVLALFNALAITIALSYAMVGVFADGNRRVGLVCLIVAALLAILEALLIGVAVAL